MYFRCVLLCFLAPIAWPGNSAVDAQLDHFDIIRKTTNIFSLTKHVLDIIEESWDIILKLEDRVGDQKTPMLWFIKKKERALLAHVSRISEFVHTTQKDTEEIRTMMLHSLKKLQSSPDAVLNGIQINELLESVRSIESDYTTMNGFIIGTKNNKINESETLDPLYSSYTLEKYADAMVSFSSGGPIKQLAKIHSFIVPKWEGFQFHTHGSIFNVLKSTMENSNLLCDQQQSLQQLIYNLYITLHFTQLKGFTVIEFSWMLLNTYKNASFEYERKQHYDQFVKNIDEQIDILKSTMSSASNMYWKCDPNTHVAGVTYTEITQLLQGYIENESDMNYEQSCMQTCDYYEVAEHKSCFKDQFCARQRTCNGRILNCRFFDSDMRLCQSPYGSKRRYDYIAYENGKTLGDASKECKGTMSNVDSWWVYLLWHCSYCFCICDSSELSSDRYFSLKEALSDIKQNKVVTGVRFIKIKQMIHLQVEEGELGSQGSFNESTRQWVNVPGYEFSYKNSSLRNNVDYHKLTYTERAVDLDNIIAPKNNLVTGVRFRILGSHLNLEVRVTPFDFITGTLDASKTHWVGNDNTELSELDSKRTEININNSDLPTKASSASEPDMSSNKFIQFTHSSIERDVAQTTLPFIDIQPVSPKPGVPLSGVGIYFKGTENFAGFIGVNVFTYDFSKDLQLELFKIKKV